MKNPSDKNFFINPTDQFEIVNTIKELSSSNSADAYGLSGNFIRIIAPKISKIVAIPFDESFNLGVFPHRLKLALVVPIYKTGSKLCCGNYRTVLPIFSKILEKLMHKRLQKILDNEKIIY